MELAPGIHTAGLGLYIPRHHTLILSDTHIGGEAALNEEGVFIPRQHYKKIKALTKTFLEEIEPRRVILNGDIKHNFGVISKAEWKKVHDYLSFLDEHSEVILIEGNHDRLLEPVAEKHGLPIYNSYEFEDIFITHGHDELETKKEVIIIGHEHPAVGLQSGTRVEQYKCFLKTKYQDKTLIVTPSMNQLTEGSNVLQEKLLSPYLKTTDILDAEAYLLDKNLEVLPFGELRNVKRPSPVQ